MLSEHDKSLVVWAVLNGCIVMHLTHSILGYGWGVTAQVVVVYVAVLAIAAELTRGRHEAMSVDALPSVDLREAYPADPALISRAS